VIGRLSVGGKIISFLEPKALTCITFTGRWRFWVKQEAIEELEKPTGAVRCTKDLVEEALFERRRDLFTEVELVFFDTTSLYFEGQGGEIGQRGHTKDHRPDLKQMVVGMAVDVEGCPICCEMWPGNTADVTTLVPIVKRLRERFRLREITVVADRGMMSQKRWRHWKAVIRLSATLSGCGCAARRKLISRCSGAASSGWTVFRSAARPRTRPRRKIKEVWVENRRYVVCLNEEERRKDAHDREAIVGHLKEQLRQGDKSLDGTKRFAKDSRKHGCFHLVGAPNGATALQQLAMSPVVVIAEGYATAATIAKHGKVPTLAAYDSGNLLSVATSIRERWPNKAIIIAGDDDHGLENNPGREKALAAAEAATGIAIFPNFSAEQRANGLTDFNDLATQNSDVISRQLDEVFQGVREQRLAASQSIELARAV
jgi:hypothetical protein